MSGRSRLSWRANCRIADTTIELVKFSSEESISANAESACLNEINLDNFTEGAIFNKC